VLGVCFTTVPLCFQLDKQKYRWGPAPDPLVWKLGLLHLRADVIAEMNREEVQRFRNENVKLNGPCLTSLLIPRNSFPACGTFPLHPAYVPTVFSALIHPCFPTAPDGLLSPRLAAAAPTSLQVVWSTPARNNAPGSPRYQLQMRPGPSTHGRLE
jgi:hypothetical protein